MASLMSRHRMAAAALGLTLLAGPALAVEPGEALADAALESRARAISAGLRCLVCQNQSIDDSNATLAKDLRLLVRERLSAGDSDPQVRDFLVARYGDFVLLRPPVNGRTLLLWLAPLLCLAGLGYALSQARERAGRVPRTPADKLSAEEERKLADLLAEGREGQ